MDHGRRSMDRGLRSMNSVRRFEHRLPSIKQSTSTFFTRFAGQLATWNDNVEETPRRSLNETFFSLPQGLYVQIFSYLDFASILNLRATCRTVLDLVRSCESVYVSSYIRRMRPQVLRLYPPPSPANANLRYLIDYQHRNTICVRLAAHLVETLSPPDKITAVSVVELYNGTGRDFLYEWWPMIKSVASQLFYLNHFLETYRAVILRRALARAGTGGGKSTFAFVPGATNWEDQLSILRQYTSRQLMRCYSVYGLLLAELDSIVVHHGFTMANVFNVKDGQQIVTSEDISILLLMGGLHHTYQILALPSRTAQRRALKRFIHSLTPSNRAASLFQPSTAKWKGVWTDLVLPYDIMIQLDKLHYTKIGIPPLKVLWLQPALKLLVESGTLRETDMKFESRGTDHDARESGRRFFNLSPYSEPQEEGQGRGRKHVRFR